MKISRKFHRTGKSCYDKYKSLKKQGKIECLIESKQNYKEKNKDKYIYSKNFCKAIPGEQEKDILKKIIDLINIGNIVTTLDIAKIALYYYYSPESLAKKAIHLKNLKNKKESINSTKTFIFDWNIQALEDEADEDPEAFIIKYKIQKFKASRSWISKFMKRNGLSLRKPHAEKRTEVREQEIDDYLNSLVDAIIKYGVNRIFNMDETRINTFSPQVKTIALKGQETVKINANNENLIEGTTYIGTS